MHMRSLIDLIEAVARPAAPSLLEAVLAMPVETTLALYLDAVTEPTVRTWFTTNFRNWLMKQPENLHRLTYLPPNANAKQKKAFEFDDLYEIRLTPATQTLIDHLLDFFRAHPNLPRLDRMSVEAVEQAAENWVKAMNAKAAREPDDPAEIKPLMHFSNGYVMVELTGANALGREGNNMGHCVGAYCDEVTSGATRIFSLRDPHNAPHATIELLTQPNAIRQIKGKRNTAPVQRYWPMIRQFLDSIKAEIVGDYRNVGLLRISDDDGGQTTMTQDQFRDMVLDPADPRGEKIRSSQDFANTHPAMGTVVDRDTALGLFVAWYGTERMSNLLIKQVFSTMPDLAVQTVAHRGNQFTPEQLAVAFGAMARSGDNAFESVKELLRVTKPDLATARMIHDAESQDRPGWIGKRQRQEQFILALAQELPQIYRELLSDDPALLNAELEMSGPRAAAPFFAFAGTDRLTSAMIKAAFEVAPADTMKRIIRLKLALSPEDVITGLDALFYAIDYGIDHGASSVIDPLIAYAKPDRATLDAAINGQRAITKRALGPLAIAAHKHIPEVMDQDLTETMLRRMDDEKYYREYFKNEPQPSTDLQRYLFNDRANRNLLHYVQIIDPSLFPLVYQKLRPAAVKPTKTEQKHKYRPDGKTQKWTVEIAKTEAELTHERAQARRTAMRIFTQTLDPLVREPSQDDNDPIDPAASKARDARHAFAQMGKAALADVAFAYLSRVGEVAAIRGSDNYGDSIDLRRFAKAVPRMRLADIIRVFDNTRHHGPAFAVLVDQAPHRVASVIRDWYATRQKDTHPSNIRPPWDDFKAPVEKDQAFKALENVWESDLPEKVQDAFASVVLKRFKPSPDKLLSMLEIANNADVTARIVKKTAKPSVDLINFLLAKFPILVLDAKSIPNAALATIFQQNFALARRLMDRDLRGWGNNGRKYGTFAFHNEISRSGPVFERYASAAETAGKTKEFEHYLHQGALEDVLDQTSRADIEANLGDYSNRALVSIVANDNTMLPLLFQRFSPERMAALAQAGLFGRSGWNASRVSVEGVDMVKIEQMARVLAQKKVTEPLMTLARLLHDTPISDSLILTLLAGGGDRDDLLRKIRGDSAKNWVADNMPHHMDAVRQPNHYMISVLFDNYAKPERDRGTDKLKLPFFFKHIGEKWIGGGNAYYQRDYARNAAIATMIKNEALKRGGIAVTLTRMLFKQVAEERARYARAGVA